jgi:hypothetical protein
MQGKGDESTGEGENRQPRFEVRKECHGSWGYKTTAI